MDFLIQTWRGASVFPERKRRIVFQFSLKEREGLFFKSHNIPLKFPTERLQNERFNLDLQENYEKHQVLEPFIKS